MGITVLTARRNAIRKFQRMARANAIDMMNARDWLHNPQHKDVAARYVVWYGRLQAENSRKARERLFDLIGQKP